MRRLVLQSKIAAFFCGSSRVFRASQGGKSAAIFVISSIVLVGVTGVGVDFLRLSLAKTELQDRLDAALLAGAQQSDSQRIETAETVFDNGSTGSITAVETRHFATETDGLSGSVLAAVPTTLSRVLGIQFLDVTATGRVAVTSTGNACLLPNSSKAHEPSLAYSGARIRAPGCGPAL